MHGIKAMDEICVTHREIVSCICSEFFSLTLKLVNIQEVGRNKLERAFRRAALISVSTLLSAV